VIEPELNPVSEHESTESSNLFFMDDDEKPKSETDPQAKAKNMVSNLLKKGIKDVMLQAKPL